MSETLSETNDIAREHFSEAVRQIVEKYGTKGRTWAGGSWRSIEDAEEAKRLFSVGNAELADYFDQAHDLLLTGGWVQKALRNDSGRCAMGAICDTVPYYQGMGRRTKFSVVRDQMFKVMEDEIKPGRRRPGNIAFWNDARGRTIDDVLDAFRRCAKRLRNMEA